MLEKMLESPLRQRSDLPQVMLDEKMSAQIESHESVHHRIFHYY